MDPVSESALQRTAMLCSWNESRHLTSARIIPVTTRQETSTNVIIDMYRLFASPGESGRIFPPLQSAGEQMSHLQFWRSVTIRLCMPQDLDIRNKVNLRGASYHSFGPDTRQRKDWPHFKTRARLTSWRAAARRWKAILGRERNGEETDEGGVDFGRRWRLGYKVIEGGKGPSQGRRRVNQPNITNYVFMSRSYDPYNDTISNLASFLTDWMQRFNIRNIPEIYIIVLHIRQQRYLAREAIRGASRFIELAPPTSPKPDLMPSSFQSQSHSQMCLAIKS